MNFENKTFQRNYPTCLHFTSVHFSSKWFLVNSYQINKCYTLETFWFMWKNILGESFRIYFTKEIGRQQERKRWTHADKHVSVMNLHQQSESWSSQCLTWDSCDQVTAGTGSRSRTGPVLGRSGSSSSTQRRLVRGRSSSRPSPSTAAPSPRSCCQRNTWSQVRRWPHDVTTPASWCHHTGLMMSPRWPHDVTTPTSWCHMFLSQSCKCVSDFVCLLCVSLCRQQPREDVDGDPLQRDDLHPAGLHAAHLLQDPQPGRRGRTRRLQRRDGDRWGLFWLVHWWGQTAALWFCDSMFTRGSVVRMMSQGSKVTGSEVACWLFVVFRSVRRARRPAGVHPESRPGHR